MTGLQPATEYCFVATASNESGTSPKSNVICDTTYGSPMQQRVRAVTLGGCANTTTGDPGVAGHVVVVDGMLDFIEVRAADNLGSLAGLALQPVSAWAKSCDVADPETVFLPPDGAIDGAALMELYGTEHPHLGQGGLSIRGCGAHGCPAPALPPVTVLVHYTGP